MAQITSKACLLAPYVQASALEREESTNLDNTQLNE